MDEITRQPAASDAEHRTDRSARYEQREQQDLHDQPEHPEPRADESAQADRPRQGTERHPRRDPHASDHPPTGGSDTSSRTEDVDTDRAGTEHAGTDSVRTSLDAPHSAGHDSAGHDSAGPHTRESDGQVPHAQGPNAPGPTTQVPGGRSANGRGTNGRSPLGDGLTGVAALLRLAVLCVDPDGRISYWNRGAEELFGHRWDHVFGHRASGLLTPARSAAGVARTSSSPHQDTLDLLDDLTQPAWAGALAATDRDGALKDVLWWTYRVAEPGGRSLLAIAAHAKPLRTGGLRIALGGRLLPYTAEGPQRQDISVAAVLGSVADPAQALALAARLGTVLPGVSAGRLDRLVRQIAPLGPPALEVDGGTRLPVTPHDYARMAAAARADQQDPSLRRELLPGPRPGAEHGPGPAPGPGHGQPPDQTPGHAAAYGPGRDPEYVHGANGGAEAAPAGDRSSASALTAVPFASLTSLTSDLGPNGSADALTGQQPLSPTEFTPGLAPGFAPGLAPVLSGPPSVQPLGTPPGQAPFGQPPYGHAPFGPEPGGPASGAHPLGSHVLGRPYGSHLPGTALDEQLALLRETGAVVGSTLDLQTTARELCAVTVPRFADFAAVLIVDQLFSDSEPPKDDRPAATVLVRRVAIAHDGPPGPWETALPEGELLSLAVDGIVPRLGDHVLVPVVDSSVAPDIALDLGVPALGPLLPGHSMIVAPLTARGTVLGRVCFLRGPGRRPFDARDAATATEVVARGAVHIDNARLHRQESRAAATLQRSMMPTRPPRIPGVRIAHHYMPGDRQAQVGGDWFDAIQLPGGRVALIVGDVMGHGLQAAAVMGQFRTAVITMAALDLPPAQLLRHLDNLAHRLGTEHLATCVYAVYDPIHRSLTLANAGHIPPVLVGYDGRAELLEIPGGAPIGVGGVPFETVEIPVPDGSWLVLCTDGLVEVRGQGIDAGLAALCATVIEPEQTPEDVCAQILARLHSEDRRDDVALLVARFEGIAPRDVAEWTLRLDHAEVATARDLTRRQLAAWGLERLSDTTELLVSELVTNAIRAASYEVELRLMRVGKLLVEVSDDNHNLPQLQRADADDEQGRGLALVSNLSRRWGTSRKAVGKVVWFELPLPA
ncbi:SpoIIE family protein phosphatase [Streptomyces sp. NPDC087422]|uniref:ATP-binding SpoIIE family protein phosphatase n=1 Tax=Streptomyces sp. NPDC087422 TaxID=3365786 RepID=UPI0037F10E01